MLNKKTVCEDRDNLFAEEDYEVLSYDEQPNEDDLQVVPFLSDTADEIIIITLSLAKELGLIALGTAKVAKLSLHHLYTSLRISLDKKKRMRAIQKIAHQENQKSSFSTKPKRKTVITIEKW